jgi:integrase
MPRVRQFTERDVAEAKVGRTHVWDTRGLYVNKSPKGVVSYYYRYTVPRQRRVTETSVGKPGITLNRAKEVAAKYREWLNDGIDPQEAKRWKQAEETTFGQVAEQWLENNRPRPDRGESWFRDKKNLLRVHSKPLSHLTLINVNSARVHKALEDLWKKHPKQVQRTAATIAQVWDFARVKGLPVAGENPAHWKGRLKILFSPKRIPKRHHASMPYRDVRAFVQELRLRQGRATAAVALEFCILTGTRTSETLKAQWSEFDLDNKTWTIPAERMGKTGEQWRVPLPARAMQLLALQNQYRADGRYVFFGYRRDRPLADRSMRTLLQKTLGRSETVHGFRASLRNWIGEHKSNFDFAAAEMCLAHLVGTKVTRAYLRTDLLDKRREILDAWADYCAGKPAAP